MEYSTSDNSLQTENDLFYFESDHLALRGNKDYSELLKTLFILSAQRERAFKDYETIRKMKKSALEDPESFLKKLKRNELDIPPMQTIAQIPFIDWYVYDTKVPEEELKAIYSDKSSEKKETIDLGKHGNKNTHKKLWTSEEQKLLEELLIKYPEEPIESRRHRKIANELKTRTEQQVASRLQKYYQKMAKAGMPVHGKVSKSSNSQRKNKHKYNMWKPTTFFPEYNVSVYMDETESVPGPSFEDNSRPSTSNTPNYLLSTHYHRPKNTDQTIEKSEIEMQMELLKRVKLEKAREEEMSEPYRHMTFKCNYCNEEPILGTRWHCSTCIQESVDFCTDCLVSQIYSENPHPMSHRFVTLPHPDDSNSNMSSDSDSESTNGNSNNISDSDASAYSSVPSVKSKNCFHSNGNIHEKNGTNGSNNVTMDRFLKDFVYDEDKQNTSYTTSDIGYAYLHSNLSMND
ncbi:ZZ-type zinc finger-containing protein 3 [Coccinella septempunctata]|uniref:ZZ-type zinc finger-containing protein 3 n=1 Tax=Coccinella septempunctata TaxID=41139 RepID=UPI001D07A656|nr:ZZ-type zinc finger-containing protein 3 [Coccinella septempunctata]